MRSQISFAYRTLWVVIVAVIVFNILLEGLKK